MKSKLFILFICLVMLASFSYIAGASQVWSFEEEHEFLISSVKDKPITFSAEMIEKYISVDGGELTGITVTSLPESSEGLLLKGSELVKEYERISRDDIAFLSFVPIYGSDSSSFTFIPESEDSIKTTAVINLIDDPNSPPISTDRTFTTIKGLMLTGNIPVSDPENDILTVHITESPKKGTISIDGTSFRYVPFNGKSGSDSAKYYVKDNFGNMSKEHTLSINIEKIKQIPFLSDMTDNAYHYSAIKAEQAGILSGETIGMAKLFYPEQTVKRSDFIVMLTAAQGSDDDLMVCVNTGLSNDSSLRMWIKPYVSLGMEKGLIDENYFGEGDTLTRAEAVYMIDKAMGKDDVTSERMFVKDIGAVPNEYLQSYLNLESEGMLNLYDGNAYPNATLTRDYAADLLYSLYKYLEK